ncbi:MAG: hypothetical protein H0T89_00970 [Deltaproteobacteria bacterium]|nr:hypothetical protein [Deltaproteobacteria bacterium]
MGDEQSRGVIGSRCTYEGSIAVTLTFQRDAFVEQSCKTFMLPYQAHVASSWPDDPKYGEHGFFGRVIAIEIGARVVRELGICIESRITVELLAYVDDGDFAEQTVPIRSLDGGVVTISVADPVALLRAGSVVTLLDVSNPPRP